MQKNQNNQCKRMHNVAIGTVPIIILLLSLLIKPTVQFFCSSTCLDASTCSNRLPTDCTACSLTLYEVAPSVTVCIPLSNISLITHTLLSPISLSGFISNNLAIYTCGSYEISGQYTSNHYLAKTFTGLTANHYQTAIRFNILYAGAWFPTDQMLLTVDSDQLFNWTYSCNHSELLCNGMNGCVSTVQIIYSHNSSVNTSTNVRFSALYTEINPSVKFWGIRDLILATKNCHSTCKICYGGAQSECLECIDGYNLLGNYCIQKCPFLTIPTLKQCTKSCPDKFYLLTNSSLCESCQSTCLICSNSTSCLVYWYGSTVSQSLWMQKLQLWIFLIILGVSLLVLILYCLLCRLKVRVDSKDHSFQHLDKSESNIMGKNLHTEEQLSPNRKGGAVRSNRKQNINVYTSQLEISDYDQRNQSTISPKQKNSRTQQRGK